MTNYWLKRSYAEVSTEPDGLSKRGYVYLLSEFFTIAGDATLRFGLSTNGTQVEFQFYEISSSVNMVRATLIEAPTVTPVPSAIVGRNLNRNVSDTHTIDFWTATTHSGGIKVASEMVGSGAKAGGQMSSSRIHVLKPETEYLMVFENTVNQATEVHLNLGWSEGEPNTPTLWETVP